jgi:hypothetical protein
MARSPIESQDYTTEALASAAEQSLWDHGAETGKHAPIVADRMRRIGAWAWQGVGAVDGLRDLILETALFLFRSPADAFYGKPILADPTAPSWVEDLAAAVGTDTPMGATLVAAAIRLDIMAGAAILPSTLAVLIGVDASRIRGLMQQPLSGSDGTVLEDANAGHPSAGRSGHRPKGAETRVTAASAFRWLQEKGRAPADAKPPAAPRKQTAHRP